MQDGCRICGMFKNDGWEIENTPENLYSDKFPDTFGYLTLYKDFNHIDIFQILLCPECGSFYLHTRSTPGGSYDAMKTYIVEKLRPLTPDEVEKYINNSEQSEKITGSTDGVRCPKCKSSNADKVYSGSIGGEVFMSFKCSNCGFEDTVDEYQLSDWYQ